MEKKLRSIRAYGKGCYGCIRHPGAAIMISYYQDTEEYRKWVSDKLRADGITFSGLESVEAGPVDLFLTEEQANSLLCELQSMIAENKLK
jgi:hypothetical protein